MSFFINTIAFCLCWFGCVSVYLASDRQLIMTRLVSKKLGWSLFIAGVLSALVMLLILHHWLSALLILFVLIMLVWIVLALVVPYFPHQPKTLIYGTTMIIGTALIGGFYVV